MLCRFGAQSKLVLMLKPVMVGMGDQILTRGAFGHDMFVVARGELDVMVGLPSHHFRGVSPFARPRTARPPRDA